MKPTKKSTEGTSHQNITFIASVNELTKIMGLPRLLNDTPYSNYEWEMETDNGNVFTVYDFNKGKFNDNEAVTWNIGAFSMSDSLEAKSEIINELINLRYNAKNKPSGSPKFNYQKEFRIKLFEGADEGFCKNVITHAAYINGKTGDKTMEEVLKVVEAQKLLYPSLYENINYELIGSNLLHIDQRIKGEYKTVCTIELVEFYDTAANIDESDV